MNMKTMFNAKISLLLSLFLSISFVNISAMEADIPEAEPALEAAPAPAPISAADQAVLREMEQSLNELDGKLDTETLARFAREI